MEEAAADAGIGEDHDDLFPFMVRAAAISEPMNPPPITAKRCPRAVLPQALVVLERAVVGDPMTAHGKTPGCHAGREQQFVEAVLGSLVVDDALWWRSSRRPVRRDELQRQAGPC